jgi:hypothetical protein
MIFRMLPTVYTIFPVIAQNVLIQIQKMIGICLHFVKHKTVQQIII